MNVRSGGAMSLDRVVIMGRQETLVQPTLPSLECRRSPQYGGSCSDVCCG